MKNAEIKCWKYPTQTERDLGKTPNPGSVMLIKKMSPTKMEKYLEDKGLVEFYSDGKQSWKSNEL